MEQTKVDIQPFVPVEVKPVHPKKGYKKTEEQLKKGKKPAWVEGKMKKITVEVTEEEYEKHVRAEEKANAKKLPKAPRKKRQALPVLPGPSNHDELPLFRGAK
jgi:hypothetical protein